jgi:hypothetical protein
MLQDIIHKLVFQHDIHNVILTHVQFDQLESFKK